MEAADIAARHGWREPYIQAILDHMQEGIAVYDADGVPLFYNPAAVRLGLIGPPSPDTNSDTAANRQPEMLLLDGKTPIPSPELPLQRLLKGERIAGQEIWIRSSDNRMRIVSLSGQPLPMEGTPAPGALLTGRDISKRKWTEQRLEVSEQRYKSLFDQHPDLVCWIDLKGTILSTNQVILRLTGFSQAELTGQPVRTLVSERHAFRAARRFERALKGKPQHFELSALHRGGSFIELNVTLVPIFVHLQIVGVYAIAQDITERKRAESMIHYLAYHDALTGLPNRLYFNSRLDAALAKAKQTDTPVAVLFLDLDRFKYINDSLGHRTGDRLLQAVAERLTQCLRSTDTLARLGGDEFTLILPEVTREHVIRTAETISERLSQPIELDGHDLRITPSIGISWFPMDGEDSETIIRHADMAMYQAKDMGKNTYQFYKHSMNDKVHDRMTLERELRLALERQEFHLEYQPQVDVRTGKLTGMEALIRWKHPEKGLVSPASFIPLAEETGLILQLGEWVIRQACLQHMDWKQKGHPPVKIGVNLSVRQLKDPLLVRLVSEILQNTGMEPSCLELEITESMAMFETLKPTLEALKQLGVQISIDDFGTGYSSLGYLKKFPVDKLKIDGCFIRDMMKSETEHSIVKAIIAMADSLRLELIAEGVEDEEQLQSLLDLGCKEVQGYLFSRPLPPQQAEEVWISGQDKR